LVEKTDRVAKILHFDRICRKYWHYWPWCMGFRHRVLI